MVVNRNRALLVVATVLLFVVVMGAASTSFVWNATPSLPTGLYYLDRSPGQYAYGDLIYFETPALALARERKYLPRSAKFAKYIVGMPGDRICIDAQSQRFSINGYDYGPAYPFDYDMQPLSPIPGCYTVPAGHVLPATPYSRSYDGRYFGAVPMHDIEGVLTPLFGEH